MDNGRGTIGGADLGRWTIVVLMIAIGVALFFGYGRRTVPVMPPSVVEAAP